MTKRRGNGEDSIYKDGDRWRGAIHLGYDDKGRRVRKKVSGRTRAEVAEKLRKLRKLVDAGTVPDDKVTVKAFLDRWLAHSLPGTVAESTEDDYHDTVRLHLAPALGRKKLAKLTVLDVDKLWQAKRDAGYSANSIRIMRTVLRKALTQAEREGILPRNVAALSAAPHVVAKEGRTLTIDQAKALLDTVAGHRFDVAIMLALAYGLRRGEVLGLHWAAVDWDAGTVRLTHSVKRIKDRDKASGRKTRLVVGELKTPKSRRTLVLTPQLVTKLRTLHTRQAKAKIAAGELWEDHGLIFASEVGTPMDPDNFSHTFSKLAKRAGLGHWHPHELRHSGASLMLAQGTPLHVVSEILGHTSIAITKDVYGHLLVDDKRAAAEAMSGALFGA
ncbi:tyrosine-type recombinase/integrase [Actinomadura sp. LD22]|uniref:Tyrosine-type recombinase/integrase n=1 Tax=Actinomadura physcomitrii TaxID=2650748 RepID=A0A6I4MG50_9ACTN|nr:tyrosine-type recombinase/integrase [Actinomadura physcomitrii]MWA01559.1 tyrosine-type recombinase/integrase [Actinomadura physcomitrii]